MNRLRLHVRKNGIDVSISQKNKTLIHYELDGTHTDLDFILQQYNPVSAVIILDVCHVDSKFIPVTRLSLYDRYSLKRRFKQSSSSFSHLMLKIESVKLGKTQQKMFVLTTCELSQKSQQIMQQIIQHKIPLESVDIAPRLIPDQALKNIDVSTKWVCSLYENDSCFTLSVFVHHHLLMVRNLAPLTELENEIVETFQYLSREAYLPGENITILQQDKVPSISEAFVAEKLNCCVFKADSFTIILDNPSYLMQPQTCYLHRFYLWPRYAHFAAISFGSMALLTSLYNNYIVHIEKCKKNQILSKYSSEYDLTQDNLKQRFEKSEERKKLIDLWQYKVAQSWTQQHFFSVFLTTFEIIHRKQFLQTLLCESIPLKSNPQKKRKEFPSTELSLKVVLSPTILYKDSINQNEMGNILKKYCIETVSLAKNMLSKKFDKQALIQGYVKKKDILLHISMNETAGVKSVPLQKKRSKRVAYKKVQKITPARSVSCFLKTY